MSNTKAYAATAIKSPLEPFNITRREPQSNDVEIAIKFCGICHSDLHQVRNEWGSSKFPMVPGHEITGVVTRVGATVKRFKTGDKVGVGCFVDSCRTCESCRKDLQQFCEKGMNATYNGVERDGKTPTQGGYSEKIVVDENYVLKIPDNLPLDKASPLLCAGITTYSPLRHWNITKGSKVAVVGLGGLGHMAVKIAVALGAEVSVLSTSSRKETDALSLGAHKFLLTKNEDTFKKYSKYFNLIINTAAGNTDLNQYAKLLAIDGTMVLVGAPEHPASLHASSLISGRKSIAGSLIGGIKETQEMLEFCSQHGITADIEVIDIKDVNTAYERMMKSDVHYRFVIDMSTL